MGETAATLDLAAGGPGPMAVMALSGLDPVALSEPSLVEVVGQIDEQVAWLHAVRASHLAELARRHAGDRVAPLESGEWREADVEPPQWERESIGLRCGISAYEARVRVETAVALEGRLPATARLLASGGVSWAHAVSLCQETAQLDAAAAGRVERAVLADGRAVTAGQYRRRARRLAAGMLPPVDPDETVERSLTSWSDASGCSLAVRLDREGGEIVATCLESLATRTDAGDTRSVATRRADALVEVCRWRLEAGDLPPTGAGVRPHLTVQISLAALTGGAGPDAALGSGAASGGAGLAGDLPVETVRRLGCDASVAVLLHGATVVDLGREARFPSPALRRRVDARDGGCRFPTCDRPARRCHAHHVVHWADGGATDEANLLLLCSRHHHLVHEGGWALHFEGETTTWTDGEGRRYDGPSPLARPPTPDPDFYVWLPTLPPPRPAPERDLGPPPF